MLPRSAAARRLLSSSLTPFLYPCLDSTWATATRCGRRQFSSAQPQSIGADVDVARYDHLDPAPSDYSSTPFTDACTLTVAAGAGGHGCISFLKEKYIAEGPPNGGDGGTGGSVYIQAVQGETSLHKIARRGTLKAERGRNGQGSLRGGARGEDLLLQVPVGTVVREVWRYDPLEDEEKRRRLGFGLDARNDVPDEPGNARADNSRKWRRDKWLLYPGTLPKSFTSADFPPLPRPRRSNLTATQPAAPLRIDLDKPMQTPLLLAAGAMGGLGNPHFVTKSVTRPKYATKGEESLQIHLQLELKLLADVGLVGLPNAGKSTLLRALTRSRTRVGNWAFTTLAPTIGTLVLDDHRGRPSFVDKTRTNVTIADIPGLIEDAHLNKGLGLGFLRHIERARVLAFVLDLSAGDAVAALKALWKEVGEYENLRERELNAETQRDKPDEDAVITTYKPFAMEPIRSAHENDEDDVLLNPPTGRQLPPLSLPPISSKPWFVVATKADLPETLENFEQLRSYLRQVQSGELSHPNGKENSWRKHLHAVPVSAIRKEGVESIAPLIVNLLES